ncbi:dimethylsulfonioproprionate lyase family protein [Limimaricola soesokkakensis]|uniref:dimethylsulfonioproprionate lyase family protein n=1 Tax=Limimaricola soesokkakensis TaxID=1343159 RepID=UPI003519551A
MARAHLALEPSLAGHRRTGPFDSAGAGFTENQANAQIVGHTRVGRRLVSWLDASLHRPVIRYPDHAPVGTHLVPKPRQFWQEGGDWFELGIGGLFQDRLGITHATRSGSSPRLAFGIFRRASEISRRGEAQPRCRWAQSQRRCPADAHCRGRLMPLSFHMQSCFRAHDISVHGL